MVARGCAPSFQEAETEDLEFKTRLGRPLKSWHQTKVSTIIKTKEHRNFRSSLISCHCILIGIRTTQTMYKALYKVSKETLPPSYSVWNLPPLLLSLPVSREQNYFLYLAHILITFQAPHPQAGQTRRWKGSVESKHGPLFIPLNIDREIGLASGRCLKSNQPLTLHFMM